MSTIGRNFFRSAETTIVGLKKDSNTSFLGEGDFIRHSQVLFKDLWPKKNIVVTLYLVYQVLEGKKRFLGLFTFCYQNNVCGSFIPYKISVGGTEI